MRIKEICETRVRYGYRRVHVMLLREGWVLNMKKTRRIYKELGLQLRNKHPKRRVKAKLREDRETAVGPNDVWAMDFVHDQLATGKKLRILTIVDIHSRFSPPTDPRFTYKGEDVVQTLERVCNRVGHPKTIRVELPTSCATGSSNHWRRKRVCFQRSRSVGLREQGHARLLTPWQTHRVSHWNAIGPRDNGERLHRGVQQQIPARMSERALVSDARRCSGKVGGLAPLSDASIAFRATVQTTMRYDHTVRSGTTYRLRCKISTAQPARHR